MPSTVTVDFAFSRASIESEKWRGALLDGIEKLPTPASRCAELYFYLQGKHAAFEGASELVGSDALLTVEVMRCSQSAVYGSRGVDSVNEALQVVGLRRLGRIALRLWLRTLMPQHLPSYNLDCGTFIRRSLACGAAMRYLYQGDSDRTETAYTIGLLHAVGRIVIDEAIRASREEDFVFEARTARRLADAERSEFGTTHAEMGGLALKAWGFSERVYGPIFKQFAQSDTSECSQWTESLAIARFMADRVMEAVEGVADPLKGHGRAHYRGKLLSDLFDYTFGIVQAEMTIEGN